MWQKPSMHILRSQDYLDNFINFLIYKYHVRKFAKNVVSSLIYVLLTNKIHHSWQQSYVLFQEYCKHEIW